jgi:hemerythrin-like domain-containing protein
MMAHTNAIELLKADHAKVKGLFEQWESAEADQKDGFADIVFTEIEIHAELEEQLFYPALRQRADEEETELLDEALKEHQEVKETIAKLKTLRPDQEDEFESTFEDLIDAVCHHVEEEETEMLPRAERKLADQLGQLGAEMERRKEQVAAGQRASDLIE